jgi:lactoylglutathione lyase
MTVFSNSNPTRRCYPVANGEQDMQLAYIIFVVPDVLSTVTFYEQAFGLKKRFIDDSKKYCEMETGQTRLAFVAEDAARTAIPVDFGPAGRRTTPPLMDLAFTTNDVQAAFNHAVASGATEIKGPEKKPWGQIVSYVRDNNGLLVEICSPVP